MARRLAAGGRQLEAMTIALLAPPVVTAMYLRVAYAPTRPHITFAGSCPGALHDSIDVWWSPEELVATLLDRGITAANQPTEFDSVLPPDRRRFYSEPGGLPARHILRHLAAPVELVELHSPDFVIDLAQQLLSATRSLIDIALPVGCSCSGVLRSGPPEAARTKVREQEPPRALAPVVDHSLAVALDDDAMASRDIAPTSIPSAVDAPPQPEIAPEPALISAEAPPRRRSPSALARPVLGTMPLRRSDVGRQLPRAYVARRRSSPRGLRQSSLSSIPSPGTRPTDSVRTWMWIGVIGIAVGLGVALLLRAIL